MSDDLFLALVRAAGFGSMVLVTLFWRRRALRAEEKVSTLESTIDVLIEIGLNRGVMKDARPAAKDAIPSDAQGAD